MLPTLFLIPARGGSKGLTGKNIRPLKGRPLLTLALDVARAVATGRDVICVSTDDPAIRRVAEAYGQPIPFMRPAELASDTVGTWEVMLHALDFYAAQGLEFGQVVLLQPTTPFRMPAHVLGALGTFRLGDYDAVISVKETEANPYFMLCEQDRNGYLMKSKQSLSTRRQDAPTVYEYNGAVYVFDPNVLRRTPPHEQRRVGKYLMDELVSLDIDTPLDWAWAEFLLQKGYVALPIPRAGIVT